MRAADMRRTVAGNEHGSVMAEFAAVAMLFFVTVCGVVEFGYFMWQYGAVSKGAQFALRHAAVSDPVTRSSSTLVASPDPNVDNSIRCWMEQGGTLTKCNRGQANHESMRCILLHMQQFASFAGPENMTVTYSPTAFNFGGEMAPTIRLTLSNLRFPTLFLGYLAGRVLPPLEFTITAEDMSSMPPSAALDRDTATTTCGIEA